MNCPRSPASPISSGSLPALLLAGPIVLTRLRMYQLTLSQRNTYVLNLATQAAIILFLLLLILQFMARSYPSRTVFIIFIPCFISLIFLRHLISMYYRYHQAEKGIGFRKLIVVTDNPGNTQWPKVLEEHPEYGFQLGQEVDIRKFDTEKFIECLHDQAAHLVIFDVREGEIESVYEGIRACENEGIEAWFPTNFIQTRLAKTKVDYFDDTPLLIFTSTPDDSWGLIIKELFDRVTATILLILISPLLLLIAILIKISSPGPALFRQERSGLFGQPFVMYKFRSMSTDAEQKLDELKNYNEMSGPVFKVSQDPRITPIGRWLRRTSMDELPQLINVVRGEMSLVGPRPLPTYETLAISQNEQRRRLSVKPGITCLWQIRGRNRVSDFHEWVRLDLEYIDNWSLYLDFKILLKTIPVVLIGTGAK
jgi:exopolysaccharide biosynthesis polyprenyl glycosylphosphotransferase